MIILISPEANDFLSLFQCEPVLLDDEIPFLYNEAVYEFTNEKSERFSVRLQPSAPDLKIEVFIEGDRIAYLDFTGDFSMEILSTQKDSSKLRIKNSTGSAVIHFRPRFKLFLDTYFPDKEAR